jgi:hypothetical protein
MALDGRVLIVERLIPDTPGDAVPTLLSDINMLVITGGQERTAEYGDLLAAAGLTIGKVHPGCVSIRRHRGPPRMTGSKLPCASRTINHRCPAGTPCGREKWGWLPADAGSA